MKYLLSLALGMIFGFGLLISGIANPDIVISGLRLLETNYNWSLIITFISGLLVAMIFYQAARFIKKPLLAKSFSEPVKTKLDKELILGSIIFGIGWGITGLCPGPNIVGLGIYHYPQFWIAFLGILAGYFSSLIIIKVLKN